MWVVQEKKHGYTTSVTITADAQPVFEALTARIDSWWGKIDKPVSQTGDEFTVYWGEPWYRFRVIEYLPNEKVRWECIDANQIIGDMQGVEKEWVGTRLFWEIRQKNISDVEVTLFHEGLVSDFLCFDVCSRTWDSYIKTHLKNYLEGQ